MGCVGSHGKCKQTLKCLQIHHVHSAYKCVCVCVCISRKSYANRLAFPRLCILSEYNDPVQCWPFNLFHFDLFIFGILFKQFHHPYLPRLLFKQRKFDLGKVSDFKTYAHTHTHTDIQKRTYNGLIHRLAVLIQFIVGFNLIFLFFSVLFWLLQFSDQIARIL